MRQIFSLSHMRRSNLVHQEERVKIRQGLIVREKVWMDARGNELDKISDDPPTFQVKPPPQSPTHVPAPIIHGYPEPPPDPYQQTIPIELQFIPQRKTKGAPGSGSWGDTPEAEDWWVGVVVASLAGLMFALWFLLGYWTGRRAVQWQQSQRSYTTTEAAAGPASPTTTADPTMATVVAVAVAQPLGATETLAKANTTVLPAVGSHPRPPTSNATKTENAQVSGPPSPPCVPNCAA